jgi:flagellar biosynthetic protein FliO
MTRYVLVCFLLLGLIGFAAYLFRRFVSASVRARASKRSLQIVDLLPLGGKQRLCVVRCYDRTFALGLGDKEVSLIAELDAQATPAKADVPFAALLRREQGHELVPQAPKATELVPPAAAKARGKSGSFSLGSLFG